MTEHQQKVEDQNAKYQEAVSEHDKSVSQKQALRYTAIIGVCMALGILVFSGLVLAVIAIERHSRAMNALLSRIDEKVKASGITTDTHTSTPVAS